MKTLFLLLIAVFCFFACKKSDRQSGVFQPKTVYYRVKMVDKNGNITYSQVRSVIEK